MSEISVRIEDRVLPSGLRLVAVHNPPSRTTSTMVQLKVSSLDERPGEEGLAYLTGACLDEGSTKRSADDLAREVESIGCSMDGSGAGGAIQGPAEQFGKSLPFLRELVLDPSFPPAEVQRVRDEVLAEITAEKNDPATVARRRFRQSIYGEHPFARPSWGSEASVQACSPDRLKTFHERQFVAPGGIIATSGPLDPKEALDQLEAEFRDFDGEAAERKDPPQLELPAESSDQHLPMDREQVHVLCGHLGIRRKDPDYLTLLVMDHVLGSGPGFTSRITKRLRDERGLCYTVHASISSSAGLQPGMFSAYIGTSPEHREEALTGFLEEMRRMRDTEVTATELKDVQDYLTGSYVFGLERNSQLVQYAIRCCRFDLPFDEIRRYPDKVRAISVDEVQGAAQRHLHPDRVSVVSAGAS